MREAGGGCRRLSPPRSPLPVNPSRFSPRPGGCEGEREGGRENGHYFPWRKHRAAESTRATASAARARLREGAGGRGWGGSGKGWVMVVKVAFETLAKRWEKVFLFKLIVNKPRVVPVLGKSVMVSPVPCASRVSQSVCVLEQSSLCYPW